MENTKQKIDEAIETIFPKLNVYFPRLEVTPREAVEAMFLIAHNWKLTDIPKYPTKEYLVAVQSLYPWLFLNG